MVFERKHHYVNKDTPIGEVSGVIDNFNNTNASGYINKIRMNKMRQEINGIYTENHFDPPPPDDD